jgi:hypothetical protein
MRLVHAYSSNEIKHCRKRPSESFVDRMVSGEDYGMELHINTSQTLSIICMDGSGEDFSRTKMHINSPQSFHLYAWPISR